MHLRAWISEWQLYIMVTRDIVSMCNQPLFFYTMVLGIECHVCVIMFHYLGNIILYKSHVLPKKQDLSHAYRSNGRCPNLIFHI